MLSFILSLAMIGQPAIAPRVAQWSPDIRQSSTGWVVGEGFTGATLRYAAPMTVKYDDKGKPTNLVDELRAGVANWSDHPTVDWATTGQNAPTETFNDNVLNAFLTIDQGIAKNNANNQACTFAFAVTNKAGRSETYVGNRPKLYGLAGADPSKLYYGSQYVVTGRNLAATMVDPTLWLWDGKDGFTPLPITQPGGRGTGVTKDLKRCNLWFEIPSTVLTGDYYLIEMVGDNQWGITSPKGCPVHVMGSASPFTTAKSIDVIANNGSDITTWLTSAVTVATTEANPTVLRLPPGVFYVNRVIDIPSNVAIVGAGMDATRIIASPTVSGDYSTVAQRVPYNGRSCMIRLTGDNIQFRDLAIELATNTVQHAVGASGGIDRVKFDRVKFVNLSPKEDANGYSLGTIYRFGLWKYWAFNHCQWKCQFPFEATTGALNGFRNNGAADNCLVFGGSFEGVHGLSSASLFGSFTGRGSLIYNLDVSKSRRGIALSAGDGFLESSIVLCHFHDMLSEYGNGETVLVEARGSGRSKVTLATATSVTIPGDTQDRTRWTMLIISGKGAYQYRVISSSIGGTHTIETPWEIVPDESSTALMVQCPTDCNFTWNRFVDCVGGINLYGNALGCVATSNWFRQSREGIMLNTNGNSAATSGLLGQNGDGVSFSGWHSFRSNTFDNTVGHHFVAPRTSADFANYQGPQIAFISTAFNTNIGAVQNILWAGEGVEQVANENGPALTKSNTIDFVYDLYSKSYSTPEKYLHRVLSTSTVKPVWIKTQAGIGNFAIRGHEVDDEKVSDPAALISTVIRK